MNVPRSYTPLQLVGILAANVIVATVGLLAGSPPWLVYPHWAISLLLVVAVARSSSLRWVYLLFGAAYAIRWSAVALSWGTIVAWAVPLAALLWRDTLGEFSRRSEAHREGTGQ